MFSILYNTIIINFFFFYFTLRLNNNYFQINKKLYLIGLCYHLVLTAIYILIFKDGAADYKTYLSLSTLKSFSLKYLISADLINFIINILKTIFRLNDFNIIFLFSLISFFGIIIFLKNLIKLGVEKNIAYILFLLRLVIMRVNIKLS